MASKKGRKSNVGEKLDNIERYLVDLLTEASKEMGINFEVELDEKKSQNNLEQGLKNLDAPPVEVEAKVTVDKTDVQKQADEIKKILNNTPKKEEYEYFKKTDEEIYASAMELAQKRENIFEEIAAREIELANKMSGEVKTAYYDMAVASNEMFKKGASDYDIEDKIEKTDSLLKELEERLSNEDDPQMIMILNHQLDEAKIKILALEEVFNHIKLNRDLFSSSDIDSDVIEKYWRTQRENFSIGNSNYSISTADREYWQSLTDGIDTEEKLAIAIEQRKNSLIALRQEISKAEDAESELYRAKEGLPYGKERDAKEEEWRKASDYTYAAVEQYNEVREELYNLIQLHDKLGQSIENAPQINNTFLGSEWRQEEQAMNAIDEEIKGIIEARKKDAEAQKEEKVVTDENTESVERNAAAIKRLTQKVRDRAKGKKWNATPEIADADFEGIISELKAAGATENDLQKVTDIFNEWKATLPSVSNVIEETTSEIKEEASVQDKIQQETEQTIKDTKEEANAHDANAEAIDRESEAYKRALKNGRGYWDEKVASYYQDEKQEFLPPAIITPSLFVNANNSADAIEEEADAADNVKESFEKAAKAKNKFNDANEQLDDLAEDGAESLEEEADALNRFPENADLLRFLEQIQEGTNTIEFGIQIDKEMAISELRKIAPEIADAFNELYGTDISSGQVVKAYQESQRQIEKLQKQQAMDDAMNYSKIQKQRADEEKKAIAEINKARKEGQKQAEEYERNQVLTEESTIRKEMALMKQRRQEAEAALRDAIKNSNDEERIQVLREESTIRKEIENLKKQERADVLTEESTIRKALANKELLERNEALVEERTLRKELEAIRKQERADVLTEESTIRHALKERQDVLKEEEKIRTKLASMTAKANANAEKEEEAYINSIYKEREDNLNRIYALKNSNAKLDEDKLKNQSKIQANEDEIAQLEARNFDLAQQVVGTTSERVEEEERLVQLEKELADQVANTARTTSAGQFDAIEKSVKSYSKKLNDIIGDPNKDTQKYTQDYREKIETLNKSLEEVSRHLKVIKDAGIAAFDPKEIEALSAEYDDLVKKMDEALKGKALSENKQFAQSSLAKLRKNIEDIMARNSAMGRDFEKRFGDLKLRIDAAESVGDVERLKAEIVDLETELIAAGKTGKSAFQKFREAISTANTQFLMQYFSIQDFIRYGQQAFEVIRELDYALVDLKKTSDMTASELEDFYYSSNDIAKSMGVTTRSIIEQAAQWSRLGYSTKEASSMMAELSSQFASISPGMGTEEAQLGLVSLMKAYHIETDEVERTLMDNINRLGNKFAETNQDIVEGMKRAGATLSAVGTSVEDSFALFTGAQEVIQNAETVGTALKTLSLRIRGYDEETEQLSEDVIAATGKVADLTKVASNGYAGVSLWADAAQTQYRSLKDYLGDIAEIWDEIDARSQTELLDKLFGKRGASVGSAILGNFDQVEKAIEEMEKAAGAADAEMDIITESIDFKLNALKETWVGTIQELLNNKQLAKFIDFLTRISEEIGKIAEAAGPFASLFAVGGIATIVPRLDEISKEVYPVLSDLFEAITKGELLSGGNSSELSYQTLSEGAQQIIDMKNNIQELIALNPKLAIGLGVVTAAVVAGAIAWDKYQISVDEWQEKIAETESKVSSLKTEIEKLRDIDFRTQDEQDRLEILNKELAAQERILEVEKERALIQEYDFTTPAQVFDSKNANNRLKKVLGTDLFGTLFHSSDYIGEGRTGTSSAVEDSTQKIVEYNQQLKNLNLASEERIEIENKLAKEESHASSYYLTLTERTAEYEQEVENAKQAQEGLTDKDSEAYKNAKKLIATYTEIINVNKAVIEAYEKATGKFDYSSIIESALSKVEFEGLEERLVGLAETGTLTEEKLKELNDASLQALLVQLDDLGVSSEVFYNWLLRIAGLVDKGNLAGKIVSQMGSHDRGWQYDTAAINSYINDLNEDELKIVAGLDIDWSAYTSADEIIKKLQSEIDKANGNPVTVGVEFDQSAFSEQVNELDALQTAYEKFRTNVNNKETKINLDIKDVDALREKLGDIEGFDFDKFELVVTTDTGTNEASINAIQEAFDEALTAYANYKIALEGINDENKEMIRTQLEMEGATKESAQTFVDVANARAKVEEAAPELEFTSLEQMAENSALWSEEYVANLDEVYKKYNGINNIERDLIVWTDENLEKYKDFLISQYGSFEAAVEDLKGTWSTVLGDTENIQGVQIAFTQMLQTENGLVPLTKEQFWTYMDSILEASTDENGKLDVNKLIKLDMSKDFEMEINGQMMKVGNLIAAAEGQYLNGIKITADDVLAIAGRELDEGVSSIFEGYSMHDVQADALLGAYKNALVELEGATVGAEIAVEDFNMAIEDEAEALGIDKAYLIEYLILKGQASGGIWNLDLTALLEEYEQLGYNCDKLREYIGLKNQYNSSGNFIGQFNSPEEYQRYMASMEAAEEEVIENSKKHSPLVYDPDKVKNDASKSGSSAADAYVKAYEKEKKELERQRDAGLISEKIYLEKLKELIDKYFKDRAEYAENYMDEMKDYMDALLTHYNSVISGVTTLLDKRINKLNKNKETITTTLTEEKEAAEERYQAEIDAIQAELDAIADEKEALQENIDLKQKEIDAIQEQIDAINEANEARDRSINLQKAEYELQRAQNQRTKLVYTGEVGQMRYERDESSLRDKQEELRKLKDDLAIAELEKQQDAIQDTIDAINEQIEALEEHEKVLTKQQEAIRKEMEATTKHYEKLIKEQEKLFDDQVKALEKVKEKWEELAAVDEVAKAWGLVADEMADYGFTVEDVLNDVPGAFDAFKSTYLNVLQEMHSGDQGYLNGLKETTSQIPQEYGKLTKAAEEAKEPVAQLGDTAEKATGKVSTLGSTSSTAAGQVNSLATSTDKVSAGVSSIASVDLSSAVSNLKDIAAHLESISMVSLADVTSKLKDIDTNVDDGLVVRMTDLANAVIALSKVTLATLSQELGNIKDATDATVVDNTQKISDALGKIDLISITDLVGDFKQLQSIIPTITSSLNGINGANGIVSVLESIQSISFKDNLISEFNSLKEAVDLVTTAINGGGENETPSGEEGGEGEQKSGLIGAVEAVKTATAENIGTAADETEDTAIGHFNALGNAVNDVSINKIGIADEEGNTENPETLIGAIGGLKDSTDIKLPEVVNQFDGLRNKINDCIEAVKTLIEEISKIELPAMPGNTGNNFRGTAHYAGTANFKGDWKVGKNETSLVGELGPEIVLDSKNGKFRTVGMNGPEITKLHPNDVVFNHKQTEQILSKKNQISGNAFADGTLPDGFFHISESASYAKLQAKIREYGIPTLSGIKTAIQNQTEAIKSEIKNIMSNSQQNTTVHQNNTFNINGVSGEDVARQINTTLVETFSGMSLNAYQRSKA